jgi:hypothetical protein
MARTPDPETGQRIRVTRCEDVPADATGTIAEVYDNAVAVDWDDPALNTRGVALLRGADRWEVLPDAPPPHP